MDLVRLDGRYRLQERLGAGSFGETYLACDLLSGQPIVIKLESINNKNQTLEHEFQVYRKLHGGVGIPHVHWFGTEYGFNAMAMDMLGHSIEDLFIQCHFRFTMKTVVLLACQLLRRLQYMHSRNFIHRDLKPANMVMGIGNKAGLVYLIDFGLSKQFRDPKTHIHIPFSNADTAHQLTGSAAFTSIHSHFGQELSRRDDLESLAYILIYLLRGSLPWQRLNVGDSVLTIKQKTNTHDLCFGLPVEFLNFINYTRSLSFSDKPDYGYLCSLFEGLLVRKGFQNGSSFDLDVDEITMLYKTVT